MTNKQMTPPIVLVMEPHVNDGGASLASGIPHGIREKLPGVGNFIGLGGLDLTVAIARTALRKARASATTAIRTNASDRENVSKSWQRPHFKF